MRPERVTVEIEDHELHLSNLDKVLYPATGFTKGQMIDYYARIAPAMLPHIIGRPLTVKRFPDGVETKGFIEKNVPRHAPKWIATAVLPRKAAGRDTTEFAVLDGVAGLIWFANMAAVEFHTPMWRIRDEREERLPDLVVFDLDPGAPAGIAECCAVARIVRDHLSQDGIELLAKTSGSKGLQLYGSLEGRHWSGDEASEYAHGVARQLERSHPDRVVSRMTKSLRPGKVLIDWSQNNPAKTTVSPYSLRAAERPSVSTPVGWQEVEQCEQQRDEGLLRFGPAEVLSRVERDGDLFAPLLG